MDIAMDLLMKLIQIVATLIESVNFMNLVD